MEPPIDQPAPAPQPIVLSYREPDLVAERPMIPIAERLFHVCAAILLPFVCFLMSFDHYPAGPEFQRGWWSDSLGMIPTAKAGWPFYPLLLFAIYAAMMVIIQPRVYINRLHIRFGLLTGIILAYQYAFIQTASIMSPDNWLVGTALGKLIPPVFVAGMLFVRWSFRRLVWERAWYRGRALVIFWVIFGILAIVGFAPAAIGSLFVAPGLTLTSFIALFLLCMQQGARLEWRKPWPIAWLVGWVLAYSAAWMEGYILAAKAYGELPLKLNDCYIATAASRGHAKLVGSHVAGGVRVTPQLAMFKAGERAIAAAWPKVHRAMRLIYNAIGPVLARRMGNPFIADLAYLSLKPLEWLTAGVLALAAARRVRSSSLS